MKNATEILRGRYGSALKLEYSLNKLTTIAIGGPARYYVEAKTNEELIDAIRLAKKLRLKWYLVGEGSNLIPSDKGFDGLIIKNKIKNLHINSQTVTVSAGYNLLTLIKALNRQGLGGMEKMAGIPGTVGAGVYGNIGAYGQEIKGVVTSVRFFDGKDVRTVSNKQCGFGYRTSVFKKHKNWIVLEVKLSLKNAVPRQLIKISTDTMKQRAKKYDSKLKCAGSFFKNIVLADLPVKKRDKLLSMISSENTRGGKLAAGYLLEQIGAKGEQENRVMITKNHANTLYNAGRGDARSVKKLAKRLKAKVKQRFGVTLEEEVQYL